MTRRLAIALAAGLPVALLATRFHVLPGWRGVTDPPAATLLALALAAGACAAFLAGRDSAVLVLAAAALPILPVLSGRLPLLLLFQGPVLAVIAFAVAAVVFVRRAPQRQRHPRERTLFAIALVFYLALGFFLPGPAGPQGDEPHYLVMAQSLLRDKDLDLQNQFRERQYAEYFAGTLEPHTSPASPPERLYSIHAPGLPALLLPGFALFGASGARGLVSLLAALTAVLTHRLLRESLGSPGVALAAWAALVFTPPLAFYSVALYPEVPAALATALFLLASRRTPSAGWMAAVALAAAALPWIHPKFLPLAALGLLLALLRPGAWPRRLAAAAVFLASLALLLLFFQRFYGAASPAAAYGPGFAGDVTPARLPRGALGLFFDRQFGLLWCAPLWALALPGLAALGASRTGDALRALLLLAASLGVGGSFSMWWGGACPPARFLIPALPALALGLAAALPRRRTLAAALFGVGLACVAIAALVPRALHNRPDGESALLRVIAPALDLDSSLPSFVVPQPGALLLAATAAAAGALAWSFGRRGVLLGAAAYLLVAGALRERPLVDARAAVLELLARWDSGNARGVAPLDPRALALSLELPQPPWSLREGAVRSSRPLELPPGVYEVALASRIDEAAKTARVATLDLAAGDLLLERRYLREDQPLGPIELVLPAGARRLVFTATGVQGRSTIDSVTLTPRAVVPRAERAGLHWPLQPQEDLYRLESEGVRVTALDRITEASLDFLVDDAARFVVEAAPGTVVRVNVARSLPGEADVLEWNRRRVSLGRAPSLVLELPADEGLAVADARFVPVRLAAPNSRIRFSLAR